jgi:hypothetical protein
LRKKQFPVTRNWPEVHGKGCMKAENSVYSLSKDALRYESVRSPNMNKLIRRAFLFLQDDVSIKEKARHLHSGKKKTGKAIPQHAGFGSRLKMLRLFQ